jgi:hypothetical protein
VANESDRQAAARDIDALETNVVLFGLRQHVAGPDSVEDLIAMIKRRTAILERRRFPRLAPRQAIRIGAIVLLAHLLLRPAARSEVLDGVSRGARSLMEQVRELGDCLSADGECDYAEGD